MRVLLILSIFIIAISSCSENRVIKLDVIKYELPWIDSFAVQNTIINRVVVPDNFVRIQTAKNSFAHWLRRLPLKAGKPLVGLYNNKNKRNQSSHMYVLDLDVGKRDLQQCADATMRLRAEYLFNNGKTDSIHFDYTNGANVAYNTWKKGYFPVPGSGKVTWKKSSKNDESYTSFKKYLLQIFNYAGTLSLSRELKKIPLEQISPGDILCTGGSPGHAVMVMDVAIDEETCEKIFLLGQGGTPAQEMHIIKNPRDSRLSPWYKVSDIGKTIRTTNWVFSRNSLMRWV